MKLNEKAIEWALIHTDLMKDTDLFPKPIEISVLMDDIDRSVKKIANIELSSYQWHSARRFLIPKKELSYRLATQLNPLDSIILAAVIYEYGQLIEERRISVEENKVFSYRYSPNKLGYLYTLEDSWCGFWKSCSEKIGLYKYAVYLDISDFYNQIYHHTVENELIACKFKNEIVKLIMRLLESLTAKTSRGIPTGPHSAHLLAEMSLIPVDNIINIRYADFCRYSDDIVVFCDDLNEARKIVFEVAEILDTQQRLVLQNSKTKIYNKDSFKSMCYKMMQDNPINSIEQDMVDIFNKYGANLYAVYQEVKLDEKEYEIFSKDKIEECLDAYLSCKQPNYERIKWLYRRLSQIRVDGAVSYTISNISKLTPAINEIVNYLVSIAECNHCKLDLKKIGDSIYNLLSNNDICISNYLKMSILSLFSSSSNYDHIDKLMNIFNECPEELKREIIIAVFKTNSDKLYSWIYGLKEQASNFNDWTRRAYYIACSSLIAENKKYYLKSINTDDTLESLIIEWALGQKN